MIKVRLAPSPTGNMHVANLRSGIYNWLFAKQNKGTLLLRIEDTDKNRSEVKYEAAIFDILKKFNIDYTLSFRQSERNEIYKKVAYNLLNLGKAFFCQCNNTNCSCMNQNLSTGVLRFKTPKDQTLSFDDEIYGTCTRNTNDIENFALLRSDETATYMLAVVVDDHESEITHIIRGEDHRTNTFKQILIYNALQWNIPIFAHIPIMVGSDGKKLSKRLNDTSVEYFLNEGYVPKAIFNMLLRTGWSYGDQEIFSVEEAIKYFNIKKIHKHSATFDTQKLKYLNQHYLKNEDYSQLIASKITVPTIEIIRKHYTEIVSRCTTINECVELIQGLVTDYKHDKTKFDTNILKTISQLDNSLNFEEWMNNIKKLPNAKEIRKTIRIITTNAAHGLPLHIIFEYKIHNKQLITFSSLH